MLLSPFDRENPLSPRTRPLNSKVAKMAEPGKLFDHIETMWYTEPFPPQRFPPASSSTWSNVSHNSNGQDMSSIRPTGSSALDSRATPWNSTARAGNTETDSWPSPWNKPDTMHSRHTSRTTSPNTTRDTIGRDRDADDYSAALRNVSFMGGSAKSDYVPDSTHSHSQRASMSGMSQGFSAQPELNEFYRNKQSRSARSSIPSTMPQSNGQPFSSKPASFMSDYPYGWQNHDQFDHTTGGPVGPLGAEFSGDTIDDLSSIRYQPYTGSSVQRSNPRTFGSLNVDPSQRMHGRTQEPSRQQQTNPGLAHNNFYLLQQGGLGSPSMYLNPVIAGTAGLTIGPPHRHGGSLTDRVMSPALKDFKELVKNKSPLEKRRLETFNIPAIYGHIVEFSGDQNGSRFLQEKLPGASTDVKERVFHEVHPNLVQLSRDIFANYVVQKLLETGTQPQKIVIWNALKGRVVELAVDRYACRVIQGALKLLLVEQQLELAMELRPELSRLSKDQHGNHLVKLVLERLPRHHVQFIYDHFRGKTREFACDQFGCRVVQSLLERGTEADIALVMMELKPSFRELSMDQHANYVIQKALVCASEADKEYLVDVVIDNVFDISREKCGSHVVEYVIAHGTLDLHKNILARLDVAGPDGVTRLRAMCRDAYANYVVKTLLKALKSTDKKAFETLWEKLYPDLQVDKTTCTGKVRQAIDDMTKTLNVPAAEEDFSSAVPTPNLSTQTNSPATSPATTNASAIVEPVTEPISQTRLAEAAGKMESLRATE